MSEFSKNNICNHAPTIRTCNVEEIEEWSSQDGSWGNEPISPCENTEAAEKIRDHLSNLQMAIENLIGSNNSDIGIDMPSSDQLASRLQENYTAMSSALRELENLLMNQSPTPGVVQPPNFERMNEMGRLNAELSQRDTIIDRLTEQLRELFNSNEQMYADFDQQEALLAKEIQNLRAQLDEAEQLTRTVAEANTMSARSMRAAHDEINALRKKANDAERLMTEARKHAENLEREIGHVKSDADIKERKAKELSGRVIDLERDLEDVTMRTEDLNKQLEGSKRSKEMELRQCLDQLNHAERKIAELANLTNQQDDEINRLRNSLKDADAKLSALSNELAGYVDLAKRQENETRANDQKNRDINRKLTSVEEELSRVKSTAHGAIKDGQALLDTIAELEREIQEGKADKARECDLLTKKIGQLEQSLQDAFNKCQAIQTESDNHKRALEEKNREFHQLQQQLKSQSEGLSNALQSSYVEGGGLNYEDLGGEPVSRVRHSLVKVQEDNIVLKNGLADADNQMKSMLAMLDQEQKDSKQFSENYNMIQSVLLDRIRGQTKHSLKINNMKSLFDQMQLSTQQPFSQYSKVLLKYSESKSDLIQNVVGDIDNLEKDNNQLKERINQMTSWAKDAEDKIQQLELEHVNEMRRIGREADSKIKDLETLVQNHQQSLGQTEQRLTDEKRNSQRLQEEISQSGMKLRQAEDGCKLLEDKLNQMKLDKDRELNDLLSKLQQEASQNDRLKRQLEENELRLNQSKDLQRELENIRRDRDNSKNDLMQMKAAHDRLKGENDRLLSGIDQLKGRESELMRNCDQATADRNSLLGNIRQLEDVISNQKIALENLNQGADSAHRLAARNAELEAQMKEKMAEYERALNSAKAIEDEKSQMARSLNDLKQSNQDAMALNQSLNQIQSQLQAEINEKNNLQRQLQVKDEELRRLQFGVKDFETERNRLQAALTKLESEIMRLQEENSRNKNELQQKVSELNQLRSQLNEVESERNRLANLAPQLQSHNQLMSTELNALKQEVQSLRNEKSQAFDQVLRLQQKLKELDFAKENLQKDLDKSKQSASTENKHLKTALEEGEAQRRKLESVVPQLEAKLRNLEQENERLKATLSQNVNLVTNEHSAIQQTIQQAESEHRRLTGLVNEQSISIAQLTEENKRLKDLERDSQQLKYKFTECNNICNQLQTANNKLEQLLKEKESELKVKSDSVTNINARINSLQTECNQLRTRCQTQQATLAQDMQEKQRLQDSIRQLKNELNSTKGEGHSVQAMLRDMESKAYTYQNNINQLNSKLSASENERNSLNVSLKQFQVKCQDQEGELSRIRHELTGLKAEKQHLDSRINATTESMSRLERENASLLNNTSTVERLTSLLKQEQAGKNQLDMKLSTVENELANWKSAAKRLEDTISQIEQNHQNETSNLNSKLYELQSTNFNFESEKSALQNSLYRLESTVADLEAENSRLKNSLMQVGGNLSALKEGLHDLESDAGKGNKALSQSLTEERAVTQSLRMNMSEMERSLAERASTIERLQKENLTLQSEIKTSSQRLWDEQAEVSRLKRDFNQLNSRLHSQGSFENEMVETNRRLSDAVHKRNNLEVQLQEKLTLISTLENELHRCHHTQSQNECLIRENERLKRNVEDLRGEVQKYENQTGHQQVLHDRLLNVFSQIECSIASQVRVIEGLNRELLSLENNSRENTNFLRRLNDGATSLGQPNFDQTAFDQRSNLTNMEHQLRQLQQGVLDVKNQLNYERSENQSLKNDLDLISQRTDQAEGHLSNFRMLMSEFRSVIPEQLAVISSLEGQIESMRIEAKQATQAANSLNSDNDSLRNQINRLNDVFNEQMQAVAHLRSQLQTAKEDFFKENKELRQNLQQERKTNSELTGHLSNLDQIANRQIAVVKKLEEETKRLKAEARNHEIGCQEMQNENNRLRGFINQLEGAMANQRDAIAKLQAEVQLALEAKVALEEHKKECENLRREYNEALNKLKVEDDAKEALKKEINNAKRSLEDQERNLRDEMSQVKRNCDTEVSDLKNKIVQLEESKSVQMKDYESKMRKLEEELKRDIDANKKSKDDLVNNLQNEKDKLDAELKKVKKEKEDIESELKETKEGLKNDKNNLQSEKDELDAELKKLKKEKENIESELKETKESLENEKNLTNRSKDGLDKQQKDYEDKINSQKKELDNLKAKISSLEEENNEQSQNLIQEMADREEENQVNLKKLRKAYDEEIKKLQQIINGQMSSLEKEKKDAVENYSRSLSMNVIDAAAGKLNKELEIVNLKNALDKSNLELVEKSKAFNDHEELIQRCRGYFIKSGNYDETEGLEQMCQRSAVRSSRLMELSKMVVEKELTGSNTDPSQLLQEREEELAEEELQLNQLQELQEQMDEFNENQDEEMINIEEVELPGITETLANFEVEIQQKQVDLRRASIAYHSIAQLGELGKKDDNSRSYSEEDSDHDSESMDRFQQEMEERMKPFANASFFADSGENSVQSLSEMMEPKTTTESVKQDNNPSNADETSVIKQQESEVTGDQQPEENNLLVALSSESQDQSKKFSIIKRSKSFELPEKQQTETSSPLMDDQSKDCNPSFKNNESIVLPVTKTTFTDFMESNLDDVVPPSTDEIRNIKYAADTSKDVAGVSLDSEESGRFTSPKEKEESVLSGRFTSQKEKEESVLSGRFASQKEKEESALSGQFTSQKEKSEGGQSVLSGQSTPQKEKSEGGQSVTLPETPASPDANFDFDRYLEPINSGEDEALRATLSVEFSQMDMNFDPGESSHNLCDYLGFPWNLNEPQGVIITMPEMESLQQQFSMLEERNQREIQFYKSRAEELEKENNALMSKLSTSLTPTSDNQEGDEILRLKIELANVEEEKKALLAQLSDLEDVVESFRFCSGSSGSYMRKSYDDLVQEIAKCNDELLNCKKELLEKENTIQYLQEQLLNLQQGGSSVDKQLNSNNDDTVQITTLNVTIEDKEKEIDEFREEISALECELTSTREAKEEFEVKIINLRKSHEDAIHEIASLKQLLKKKDNLIHEINESTEILRAELQAARKDKESSQDEVNDLRESFKENCDQVSSLKETVSLKEKEIQERINDIANLREELISTSKSKESLLTSSQKEISQLRKKHESSQEEVVSLKKQIINNEKELNERKNKISVLREEGLAVVKSKELIQSSYQLDIDNLHRSHEELIQEIASLKKSIKHTEKDQLESKYKIVSLQEELSNVQKLKEANEHYYEMELDDLRKSYESALEEMDSLSKNVKMKEDELLDNRATIMALQEELTMIQGGEQLEVNDPQESREHSIRKIAVLKHNVKEKDENLIQLQKKLSTCEAALNSIQHKADCEQSELRKSHNEVVEALRDTISHKEEELKSRQETIQSLNDELSSCRLALDSSLNDVEQLKQLLTESESKFIIKHQRQQNNDQFGVRKTDKATNTNNDKMTPTQADHNRHLQMVALLGARTPDGIPDFDLDQPSSVRKAASKIPLPVETDSKKRSVGASEYQDVSHLDKTNLSGKRRVSQTSLDAPPQIMDDLLRHDDRNLLATVSHMTLVANALANDVHEHSRDNGGPSSLPKPFLPEVDRLIDIILAMRESILPTLPGGGQMDRFVTELSQISDVSELRFFCKTLVEENKALKIEMSALIDVNRDLQEQLVNLRSSMEKSAVLMSDANEALGDMEKKLLAESKKTKSLGARVDRMSLDNQAISKNVEDIVSLAESIKPAVDNVEDELIQKLDSLNKKLKKMESDRKKLIQDKDDMQTVIDNLMQKATLIQNTPIRSIFDIDSSGRPLQFSFETRVGPRGSIEGSIHLQSEGDAGQPLQLDFDVDLDADGNLANNGNAANVASSILASLLTGEVNIQSNNNHLHCTTLNSHSCEAVCDNLCYRGEYESEPWPRSLSLNDLRTNDQESTSH